LTRLILFVSLSLRRKDLLGPLTGVQQKKKKKKKKGSDRVDGAVHDHEEREAALLEVHDVGAAVLCRDNHQPYARLIDSCINQIKAQGPSRTCDESKEEEDNHQP